MKDEPLVSVLMTVYNRETFISEAIESVLHSGYENIELIIVDDCSTDNSLVIASDFAQIDQRIKIYQNEKNLGDYANRNRAAGYASGEYLMSIDSDDALLPGGVQNCLEAMNNFPEAMIGMYWIHEKKEPFILSPKESLVEHFYKRSFLIVGPGGTIMKRSFFESIGKYPEKYGPANDMYFNLKAASHAPVVLLPFKFIFYRRHEGQQINNKYSYLVNNYRYLQDALQELPLPLSEKEIKWLLKKNKRRFAINIFKYYFNNFNYRKTAEAIRLAGYSWKDAAEGLLHF